MMINLDHIRINVLCAHVIVLSRKNRVTIVVGCIDCFLSYWTCGNFDLEHACFVTFFHNIDAIDGILVSKFDHTN